MISTIISLVYKKSIKYVLFGVICFIELLLFISCGLSNKEDARPTTPDSITGFKTNCNLQNEIPS